MHDPKEMPARLAAFLHEQEPDWQDIEVTSYEVMTGGYSRLLAKAEVRDVILALHAAFCKPKKR